jgi:hypothetical protein
VRLTLPEVPICPDLAVHRRSIRITTCCANLMSFMALVRVRPVIARDVGNRQFGLPPGMARPAARSADTGRFAPGGLFWFSQGLI